MRGKVRGKKCAFFANVAQGKPARIFLHAFFHTFFTHDFTRDFTHETGNNTFLRRTKKRAVAKTTLPERARAHTGMWLIETRCEAVCVLMPAKMERCDVHMIVCFCVCVFE